MGNTNIMAGEEIGAMYTRMANKVEIFADQGEKFYNIIAALKAGKDGNGAPFSVDRLQLMDKNHEIRILPPEPVEASTNGHKPAEVTAETSPLPDLSEDVEPKLAEANNGH